MLHRENDKTLINDLNAFYTVKLNQVHFNISTQFMLE